MTGSGSFLDILVLSLGDGLWPIGEMFLYKLEMLLFCCNWLGWFH